MTAPRVEAIVARTVIVNDLSTNALVTRVGRLAGSGHQPWIAESGIEGGEDMSPSPLERRCVPWQMGWLTGSQRASK
jgi:hypothetical protein